MPDPKVKIGGFEVEDFHDLEGPLYDATHMAGVAVSLVESYFRPAALGHAGDCRLINDQVTRLTVLIFDLQARLQDISEAFHVAAERKS